MCDVFLKSPKQCTANFFKVSSPTKALLIRNKILRLSHKRTDGNKLNIKNPKVMIQTFALPHFDYASITLMNSDTIRALSLQTDDNACITFIFDNIPSFTQLTLSPTSYTADFILDSFQLLTASISWPLHTQLTPEVNLHM